MKDNNNIFEESSENITMTWFSNDARYMIKITNDYYVTTSGTPPNKFHRFMMKLLLGWEFTVFGGEDNE